MSDKLIIDHQPVRFLRRYITMQIRDVRANPAGVVIEIGPVGHMSSRRILLAGITACSELRPSPTPRDPDDDNDPGIGDELAERRRYEEEQ